MKKFSLNSGDPIFELTINCPRENNSLKNAAFFIKSSLFIYLAVKGSYEKLTASPMFTSGKKRLIINSMNGKKKNMESDGSVFDFTGTRGYVRIKIPSTFEIALF